MKSPKKLAPIFAEIEPYIYLCNVKEMIIVELIKKSNEFSVVLIQWLSLKDKAINVQPLKELE